MPKTVHVQLRVLEETCPRTKVRLSPIRDVSCFKICAQGAGGKTRRRGKNENEEKRELILKEDGQGSSLKGRFSEWSVGYAG